MAPIKVHIKHAGKKHDLELHPEQPPLAFKEAVYQLTGVPIDRMKVMVKGGVLKVLQDLQSYIEGNLTFSYQDDSNWEKIGPKEVRVILSVSATSSECGNRARRLWLSVPRESFPSLQQSL